MDQNISRLIYRFRKEASISQGELAKKIGVSRPTLAAIEKGERDISFSELEKLVEVFDVPLDVVLNYNAPLSKKISNVSENASTKFLALLLECIKYGSDSDNKITKTKLAKLVYLCDFASYYKYLKPISGFEYKKLEQGPVAIEFFDMIDNSESVNVTQTEKGALMISLIEEPNDSVLSSEELELIKEVCGKWKKANTKEIVDFTHKQLPWALSRQSQVIPYELINMEEPDNVY